MLIVPAALLALQDLILIPELAARLLHRGQEVLRIPYENGAWNKGPKGSQKGPKRGRRGSGGSQNIVVQPLLLLMHSTRSEPESWKVSAKLVGVNVELCTRDRNRDLFNRSQRDLQKHAQTKELGKSFSRT